MLLAKNSLKQKVHEERVIPSFNQKLLNIVFQILKFLIRVWKAFFENETDEKALLEAQPN